MLQLATKTRPFTRQKAAAVILLTAAALALIVMIRTRGGVLSAHYNVTTAQGRADYLAALGWEVDLQTEEAQRVTLPRTFDGVFAAYNDLQRKQGFDLRPYAGLECTVYSYLVTNYGSGEPALAVVYLYRNRIIAGDIHATALGGFMHGIRRG